MTYDQWMNWAFDLCVWILVVSARGIGMAYNELNIWVFVIIHPAITLILGIIAFYQAKKIRCLKLLAHF
ncbi:MAG: hypothetical protein QNL74_03270 [Rhodobacter sp.]|jgi:uncharacterized membrane protein